MLILENYVAQRRLLIKEYTVLIMGQDRKKKIKDALDANHQGW